MQETIPPMRIEALVGVILILAVLFVWTVVRDRRRK